MLLSSCLALLILGTAVIHSRLSLCNSINVLCLLHARSDSQTGFSVTACSVLLLPESEHNFAGTSGMQPVTPAKGGVTKSKLPAMPPAVSRLEWQQYMGGAKASRADAAKKQPELLTWPYADSQTGSEMPGMLPARKYINDAF